MSTLLQLARLAAAGIACTGLLRAQEPPSLADGDPPPLVWRGTEYVRLLSAGCQAVGLAGTDLGVSFEASGRLVFLFGDSWTLDKQDWDDDSVAWMRPGPLGRKGFEPLEWLTRDGKRFLPLAPKGLRLGGMNVPVEGFAVGDRTYVFFDGGWDAKKKRHSHSLLAHTRKLELGDLELDHTVPSTKFLNVSVVQDAGQLWIFGTGEYRKSAIYLARVPVSDVANRAAWRYWPDFAAGEERAEPLVDAKSAGELSVRRDPRSGLWFLAYNATAPRGILLQCARRPTGPWTDPAVIFDPVRDEGYGFFMHRKTSAAGYDDGLSEPGREEEWGGEYGPYLVPAWFDTSNPGGIAIAYTLSTWNPYQVHVLRSYLAMPGAAWSRPERPAVSSAAAKKLVNARFEDGTLEGWSKDGDGFALARHADGGYELTTHVKPAGDTVRGRVWQDFTVPDDARELRFRVKGGSESVRLLRDGAVLRATRGLRTNTSEVEARWMLAQLRGATVRLEIRDDSTAKWGFVTVRGFELVR